jgi:DNA-binding transcriptional ArsR family regulator
MLDDTFLALSHPIRRSILQHLTAGEATVNELVELFELTQPSISNHLRVLERAGLVTRSRDAQYRPVRLNRAAVSAASQWLAHLA